MLFDFVYSQQIKKTLQGLKIINLKLSQNLQVSSRAVYVMGDMVILYSSHNSVWVIKLGTCSSDGGVKNAYRMEKLLETPEGDGKVILKCKSRLCGYELV
jgi:hypothetical protein